MPARARLELLAWGGAGPSACVSQSRQSPWAPLSRECSPRTSSWPLVVLGPVARAAFGGTACDGWAFVCGPPRVAVRLARSSENPPDMAPPRRRHFFGAVDDASARAAEESFFWLVGQAVYLDVCDFIRMKRRVATSPRCEREAGQSIAPEKCQWRRTAGRGAAGRRHATLGDAAAFGSKLRLRPAYCIATALRSPTHRVATSCRAWLRRVRERPRLSQLPPRRTP